MFSFSTTAKLHHVTPLPPGITFEQATSQLQNHDLMIRLDPEFAHYENLPEDPANPDARRYKVTDHMAAVPMNIWDTTVSFEAEVTDKDYGIYWVIKAPLNLVQRTTFKILKTHTLPAEDLQGVEESDKGEWSLVEDCEINCNRIVVGIVRGKCEQNWRGIHGRYVEHLKGKPVQADNASSTK